MTDASSSPVNSVTPVLLWSLWNSTMSYWLPYVTPVRAKSPDDVILSEFALPDVLDLILLMLFDPMLSFIRESLTYTGVVVSAVELCARLMVTFVSFGK